MRLHTSTLGLFVACCAFSFLACADTSTQTEPVDSTPVDGDIAFETVAQGDASGYTRGADPQNLAGPTLFRISDQPAWDLFWARHNQLLSPAPPVPEVDFSSQVVLAVVDGPEPTVTRIEIAGIVSADGVLTVRAYRTCMPWMAVTWPFHIVRVNGHGWQSEFLELTDVDGGYPCSD